MPVIVNLDVMLARRKMRSNQLARKIGITESNLSLLKSGRVRGMRFSTLAAICHVLECEPGDLLGYERSDDDVNAEQGEQETPGAEAADGRSS